MISLILRLLTRYGGFFFDHFSIEWDRAAIKDATARGPVLFCMSHGGFLESFILRRILMKEGLPHLGATQSINADPRVFMDSIQNRHPVLLFIGEGEIRARDTIPWSERFFDILARHPRVSTEHITVIPLLLLWQKAPDKKGRTLRRYLLGSRINPTFLGKILMMLGRRSSASIQSAPAIDLRDYFLQTHKNPARALRRKAVISIIDERRVSLGPMYYNPAFVRDAIFSDHEFRALVDRIAQEEATPAAEVFHRAGIILDEVAARQNYWLLEILFRFFNWYWGKKFKNIYVNESMWHKVRELNKKVPIVLIPCHRTHLDYLLISYLLLSKNMASPHIAAGINLNFWPVGRILRAGGAYFIRRSFRGDRLYSEVLRRYVKFLFDKGFTQMFFIEGGRSRTGKLLPPKYGMMKMFVEAYGTSAYDDLLFIPVGVTYDQIPELSSYQREATGGKKSSENMGELLKARQAMKNNLGSCYVYFGEPVSLRDSMKEAQEFNELQPDQRLLMVQKLSFRILHRINRVVVVTPTGLIGMALLQNDKTALTENELLSLCQKYLDYLRLPKYPEPVPIAQHLDQETSKVLLSGVEQLARARVLTLQDDLISVDLKRAVGASLPKNNIIHHFLTGMVVSLSKSVMGKSSVADDCFQESLLIRDRLKFEFFFRQTDTFKKEFEHEWEQLNPILNSEDGGLFLRRSFRFLFESYAHTTACMISLGHACSVDKVLDFVRKEGRRSLMRGKITCSEAVSDFYFKNALSLLENLQLIERQVADSGFIYAINDNQLEGLKAEQTRFQNWASHC